MPFRASHRQPFSPRSRVLFCAFSFLSGAILLLLLGSLQKAALGVSLKNLRGHVLPFLVGGTAGLCIGLWQLRLRVATFELKRRETQLRSVFSAARDVAFVTCGVEGVEAPILDYSPGAENLFGYSREEVLGRPLSLFHPPDRLQRMAEILTKVLREGEPFSGEGFFQRRSGELFPALFTTYPIFGEGGEVTAILGVVIDITERKKAEELLRLSLAETREARDRLDCILMSLADGLLVTNRQGRVVLLSPVAAELLAVDPTGATGCPVGELLAGAGLPPEVLESLEGGTAAGQATFPLPGTAKGGDRFVEARFSSFGEDGGRAGALITLLRDVTREREVERMRSEFIATAAHQLQTPLTVILGYSELLLGEVKHPEEEQRQFLATVQEKAQALSRLVDDILEVSRIETGRGAPLTRTSSDLCVLLREAVFAGQKASERHRFELDLPASPLPVEVDRPRIRQVLDHLLSNAVKYSPSGGTIRVSASAAPAGCRVIVRDEGVGMTPEQVERVFEKFYRADASDTAVSGLGLGMALVRHIVREHGGEVNVESRAGEGTQVVFTLPSA